MANESKKRIEDANLERDRVLLKEQQYLTTNAAELRWCRKGRGNGRMRSSDSTCSICL